MIEPTEALPPTVPTILQRARRMGESSWRVGVALGMERAELERIELELDRLGYRTAPRPAGRRPSGRAEKVARRTSSA